jgi:hypothetical protein
MYASTAVNNDNAGICKPGLRCLCDVTLSVYPHRAGLKNMPGHGFQACPVWIHTQSNITQASYSPECITPTQQIA